MSDRTATISRKTNETEIEVYINLDCQPGSASQQIINISTGIGFLDHVRFSTPTGKKNPLHTVIVMTP
jgi:imidazoleglycerol-phosphate dehydratase